MLVSSLIEQTVQFVLEVSFSALQSLMFLSERKTKLNGLKPGVVVHAFNFSTWEAEAGGSPSLKLAWCTERVPETAMTTQGNPVSEITPSSPAPKFFLSYLNKNVTLLLLLLLLQI